MLMKQLFRFIVLVCIMLVSLDAVAVTVVIDPGHGGRDAGARGNIALEKNINLDIALRLGRLLEQDFNIKVIYTRTTDSFVDLHQRASIANDNKADLFISLHCNSMNDKTSGREKYKGTVTYILGLDAMTENLEVVHRENSVVSYERDFTVHYQSFDANSPESHVIYELNQRQYLNRSLELAQLIQSNMKTIAHQEEGGIYQAAFIVLSQVAMPSVLVEMDYISNPERESFMISNTGAQSIAQSLAHSITTFITK